MKDKETLKEVAENEASIFYEKGTIEWNKYRQVFELGAKWQAERMYSEEDIAIAFNEGQAYSVTGKLVNGKEWAKTHKKEWFEQFKINKNEKCKKFF
jgi:hypothetical protein